MLASRKKFASTSALRGKATSARFVVRAFAQPHADAVGEQLFDVGLGAIEIGLDNDANRAAKPGTRVDAAHNVERSPA